MKCLLNNDRIIKFDKGLTLKEIEFVNVLFNSILAIFSNYTVEFRVEFDKEKMKKEMEDESENLLNKLNKFSNVNIIKMTELKNKLIHFIMFMIDCPNEKCKFNSNGLCLTENYIFIKDPLDEYKITVKTANISLK